MAVAPMIFSHANAGAVFDHERNIDNDLAKACATTGGVVGVSGVSLFVGDDDPLVLSMFRHIDHWVQLLGADHVGIGLDSVTDMGCTIAAMKQDTSKWPGDQGYQTGNLKVCDPEDLIELTERMLKAGYSDADCRGILGENWQRLANRVWRGE